jgi:hypothetical protein
MSRRVEEFYCDTTGGGCGKYFLTNLRTNVDGNYTIVCPNPSCHHEHFRVVTGGLVTRDRHQNRTDGACEKLIGLRTTLRQEPWHSDPSFLARQQRAYNATFT